MPGRAALWPRLVCSSLTFRQLPLEVALAEIASCGFEGVELAGMPGYCEHFDPRSLSTDTIERIAAALDRSGLRLAALQTGLDGDSGTDGATVSSVVAAASSLGARSIHCGVPRAPSRDLGDVWDEAIRAVGSRFRFVAEQCAEHRLMLCVEAPHNRSIIRDALEAKRLIESIGHPSARLTLDTAHHHKAGWAMDRVVGLLGDHVGHVHLRDQLPGGGSCVLGSGSIDFSILIEMLAARGYPGAYSIEMPESDGQAGSSAARAAASRMAFLNLASALAPPQ
jgi:sugar phosphate isomerase/epimerase